MNLSSVEKEVKSKWEIERDERLAREAKEKESFIKNFGVDAFAFVDEAHYDERKQRDSDVRFFGLEQARSLCDERRQEYEAAKLAREEDQRLDRRNLYGNDLYSHLPKDAAVALKASKNESNDTQAYQLLSEWKVGDKFGLFLLGPSGCGKSFALFKIIEKIISHPDFFKNECGITFTGHYYGHEICWFPVAAGLDKIRSEFEDTSKTKKELMNKPFAFFDDLGAENLTEWAREQLYLIIEHRLNRGLVTFFSTNCTLTEIKTRYHERFISRIKEMCVVIEMKGADRRTDKMKNHLETLKERMIGEANEKH